MLGVLLWGCGGTGGGRGFRCTATAGHPKSIKCGPRAPRNRVQPAKTKQKHPRANQELPKSTWNHLESDPNRFSNDFRCENAALEPEKSLKFHWKNSIFELSALLKINNTARRLQEPPRRHKKRPKSLETLPRSLQDAPRRLQEGSKTPPRRPQDDSRRLKDAPNTPQDAPKNSQDALKPPVGSSKTPQEVTRHPQDTPKTSQDAPKRPQDASKTSQETFNTAQNSNCGKVER